MQAKYFYLLRIQYLGFRYHGWAKQPKLKTVHHMIDRTLKFVLGEQPFKTLGGSRTDAMVSAEEFVLELFLDRPLNEPNEFLHSVNRNLPADIRALGVEETTAEFNIIQQPKIKVYRYFFAHGEKAHPFAAPFLTTIPEVLDINAMREAAALFQGTHEFRAYCKKPKSDTNTLRTIERCELMNNDEFTASFFPQQTYVAYFESKGFMRNQIRLMMGQLFRIGKGEIDANYLKNSLTANFAEHLEHVAPASGLQLQTVSL